MSVDSSISEENLRYPIGRYEPLKSMTAEQRAAWIRDLEQLPARLRDAVAGLNDRQLDTPYRPGGWTVRQVVHHYPDSHMNAYTRFRLALTEDSPTVKTYEEARWAELADAKTAPVEISLTLLDGLHARWTALLKSLGETDFARTFKHPEWGEITLDWALGSYAWHSHHHVAQITSLRHREGWQAPPRA